MEEISVNRILETLLGNIKKIAFIVGLTLIIMIIYFVFFAQKEYKSTATVVMPKSGLIDEYTSIIKTNEFLEEISQKYNLSTNELIENLNVDLKDKKIFTVRIIYKGENSETVANITNDISNKFVEYINDIYKLNNVKVSQPAEPASVYYNYNIKAIIKKCVKSTIIIACIYIFIILSFEFFSNKIKTQKYVTDILNFKILANVPKFSTGEKNQNDKLQYDNLVNKITKCLKKNGKNVFMFSNTTENVEIFNEILHSFDKLGKKIILLNLNDDMKLSSFKNIIIKQHKNSNYNDYLNMDFDYLLINSNKIDGISLNEKIFDIVEDVIVLAKRNVTKIIDLELTSKILNDYNKNKYCIFIGKEF